MKLFFLLLSFFFFTPLVCAKTMAVLRVPSLAQWEAHTASTPFVLDGVGLKKLRQLLGQEYGKISAQEPAWVLWCLREDDPFKPDLVFLLPPASFENPALASKTVRDKVAVSSNPEALAEAEIFYTEERQKQVFSKNAAWGLVDVPSWWTRYRSTAQMMRGIFSMAASDQPEWRKQCNQSFEFLFWILDASRALSVLIPLDSGLSSAKYSCELDFDPESVFATLFQEVPRESVSAHAADLLGAVRLSLDPSVWKRFLLQYADRLQQNALAHPEETEPLKASILRVLDAFPQRLLVFDAVTHRKASPALEAEFCFETPGHTIALTEVKQLLEALFLNHPYSCATQLSDSPQGEALTVRVKPKSSLPENGWPLLLLQWTKMLFSEQSELTFQFFQKPPVVVGTLGTGEKLSFQKNPEPVGPGNAAPFFELFLEPSILAQLLMPALPPPKAQGGNPLVLHAFKTAAGVRIELEIPKSAFNRRSQEALEKNPHRLDKD